MMTIRVKTRLVTMIGLLSTLCISVTLLPQVVVILQTHNVRGLSLLTYVIYDVGNAAGLIYGSLTRQLPVVATSVITLCTSLLVTGLLLYYR
jgi:MtN3 and saliva related transmembrane protein